MTASSIVSCVYRRLSIAALLYLVLFNLADSSAAVVNAPATSANGTYTVHFSGCSIFCMLEEKVGAGGSFSTVAQVYGPWPSNIGPGNSSYAASNKPNGIYYYRVADLYTDFFSYAYYDYSTEVSVTVGTGTSSPADTVAVQSLYQYQVRQGNLNGDGFQDLFVSRTAGGAAGNGVIKDVVLLGKSGGGFNSLVPDASQVSTASSWPLANTNLGLVDMDVDGFVDVVLKSVGNVISGSKDQILLSPGQSAGAAPKSVVSMDAAFVKFVDEIWAFNDNQNYYYDNAPIVAVPVYGWAEVCGYVYYPDYGYVWDCWLTYTFLGYQYFYDFSAYDQRAVALWDNFPTQNGVKIPSITPGSTTAAAISAAVRNVLGVDPFRGILLSPGCQNTGNAFSYDGETTVPCINLDFFGQLILQTLRSTQEEAPARNCRYLTPGEKLGALNEGLIILRVDWTQVCNYAYKTFGVLPQNRYLMSPNGNIYIGMNSGIPWSIDYSLGPLSDFGYIIHELAHVYQHNTRGCNVACMYLKATEARAGAGYIYYPLDPAKGYFSHNIEQQAEMVSDRFRIRRGYPSYLNDMQAQNRPVTLTELNQKIPF